MEAEPEYTLLSFLAYGKTLGVSDTAIHKAVEQGRILESAIYRPVGKKAKIRKELADEQYVRNTNPNQVRPTRSGKTNESFLVAKNKSKAKEKKKPSKTEKQAGIIAEGIELDENGRVYGESELNDDPVDLYTAREQEAIWKAINIKLKTQAFRRTLVDLKDVNIALTTLGVDFRMDLTAIPERIASDLMAAADKFEINKILSKAIEEVLVKHSELVVK